MAKPKADFSFSPGSGNAPLSVQCTDLSTGDPLSWMWKFDDGLGGFATSTEQNPVHVFTAPPYLRRYIELTVQNEEGMDTKRVGPWPGGVYLNIPST